MERVSSRLGLEPCSCYLLMSLPQITQLMGPSLVSIPGPEGVRVGPIILTQWEILMTLGTHTAALVKEAGTCMSPVLLGDTRTPHFLLPNWCAFPAHAWHLQGGLLNSVRQWLTLQNDGLRIQCHVPYKAFFFLKFSLRIKKSPYKRQKGADSLNLTNIYMT